MKALDNKQELGKPGGSLIIGKENGNNEMSIYTPFPHESKPKSAQHHPQLFWIQVSEDKFEV